MRLWKRNCRYLGIIFILVLLGNLSLAKELDVSYPDKVNIGEEFEAEIKLIDFAEGNYDLKIDILGSGNRIGQIYNEKLQSTYYFVEDIFENNEAKIKLKIDKEFEGEADIIIKIRDSSGTSISFGDYKIEVVPSESIENKLPETNQKETTIKDNEEDMEKNNSMPKEEVVNKEEILPLNNKEVIDLSPQNIKNDSGKEIIFESKNNKIKEYAIYGFAIFCVLIIILILIEKQNK